MTKGIVICKLWKRKGKPSVNAEKLGRYESGDEVEILDVVFGETENDYYEGTPTWYKLTGDIYVWSGGVSVDRGSDVLNQKLFTDKAYQKEAQETEEGSNAFPNNDLGEEIVYNGRTFQAVLDECYNNGAIVKKLNYHHLTKLDGINGTGAGVLVSVFDTGIHKPHIALKSKFPTASSNTTLINDHGTRVASLIGANGNKDLIGIAPDSVLRDLNIYNHRGFIDADITIELLDELLSLKRSGANGIKAIIINISQSLSAGDMNKLKLKLEEVAKELIVVASAGEADSKTNQLRVKETIQYPASLKDVISVGTFTQRFIDTNNLEIHDSIDFLVHNYTYYAATNQSSNNNYRTFTADSAAAAVVSSVIANMISKSTTRFPDVSTVKSGLKEIALPIGNFDSIDHFKIYQP